MKETFSLTSKCILIFLLTFLGSVGCFAIDEELVPVGPPQYDFEAGGIYYNILSDTDLTLEVTKGEGYTASSIEIPAQVEHEGKTYTVTRVGEEGMSYCMETLTRVTLPETITSIGDAAFAWNKLLTQINIPSSVTTIGKDAFFYCSLLESLDLPEGLTTIGENAFMGCGSISEIIIPSTVTSIGNAAFGAMISLTYASLPATTTDLPMGIFSGCTTLSTAIIPAKATRIAKQSFSGCKNIVEADIPEGVTEIDTMAFYNNLALTSITIPANVTSIAKDAFSNCPALTDVYLESTTPPDFSKSFKESTVGKWVTVHIPAGTYEVYSKTKWALFCTLTEMASTTGIDFATSDIASVSNMADCYSLGGQHQSGLSKGVNIVRMSDGSVRKIMVK